MAILSPQSSHNNSRDEQEMTQTTTETHNWYISRYRRSVLANPSQPVEVNAVWIALQRFQIYKPSLSSEARPETADIRIGYIIETVGE